MSKAFDIHRRPRPTAPHKTVRANTRSGLGLFFGFFVLAIIISLASTKIASDPLQPTLPTATPNPTITKPQPSLTVSPSITPSSSPSPTTSPTPSASPTPSPTPTITPTPTEPDKNMISMRILNGSGTPGQAALLQTSLRNDGFTVRSIATARTRRANTIIYYATGKQTEAEYVAGFITNRVLVFEENSALASPDTLLIIVGAK